MLASLAIIGQFIIRSTLVGLGLDRPGRTVKLEESLKMRWDLLGVGLCAGLLFIGLVLSPAHQSPNVLLCSDGRCGQSSKLSREGAERDLNLWADKEELKNKLDELQTVMDRGMTHKAASQQLNQYFNQLDHEARAQERAALGRARVDSLADATEHSLSTTEATKSSVSIQKTTQGKGLAAADGFNQKSAANSEMTKSQSKRMAAASRSKLTAAAAVADLNSYFDSLPTSRRASKVLAVYDRIA
jgi:hypothetical protein